MPYTDTIPTPTTVIQVRGKDLPDVDDFSFIQMPAFGYTYNKGSAGLNGPWRKTALDQNWRELRFAAVGGESVPEPGWEDDMPKMLEELNERYVLVCLFKDYVEIAEYDYDYVAIPATELVNLQIQIQPKVETGPTIGDRSDG